MGRAGSESDSGYLSSGLRRSTVRRFVEREPSRRSALLGGLGENIRDGLGNYIGMAKVDGEVAGIDGNHPPAWDRPCEVLIQAPLAVDLGLHQFLGLPRWRRRL